MTLFHLENYINGIALGIEISCACMQLLLLVAISLKKYTTDEMYYYRSSVVGNTVALLTDIAAYLVTGNKELTSILLLMSIMSYIATSYAAFCFYAYLKNYYKERYGIEYRERELTVAFFYVILISVIYMLSIWTGWFYFVNSQYMFEMGQYASFTALFYFPLLFGCYWVAYKNRRIASRRATWIHCMFCVIYLVLGYFDARFMTTVHYLGCVLFSYLIYIVISIDRDQELARKETELVKSELNALRLQMNPHFIYNTLASIDGLIMFDPEGAHKLIAKFTKHLRGSYLDNSPVTIPFEKELENLESYFAVEQVRFPEIQFVKDIQVKDFDVPPLTVQPIFENSIKHGIRAKDETEGTITLSTYERDQCYHILISDDGVGYDVNQKKEPDGRAHLGVANTRKRLELICNGKMIITSTPGVGTTVDMIIPKKENRS